VWIFAASLVSVCLALSSAQAQDYPSKTIKLIVPFTPGGPVDALGRVVAQQLQMRL
jgi:tripartite-type tricarboxylate transporter receptor subunit TctC